MAKQAHEIEVEQVCPVCGKSYWERGGCERCFSPMSVEEFINPEEVVA